MSIADSCGRPVVARHAEQLDLRGGPTAMNPTEAVRVWPRFRSGDYLVTLELAVPVKTHEGVIAHIDVFMSELVELERPCSAGAYAPLRLVTLFLTL